MSACVEEGVCTQVTGLVYECVSGVVCVHGWVCVCVGVSVGGCVCECVSRVVSGWVCACGGVLCVGERVCVCVCVSVSVGVGALCVGERVCVSGGGGVASLCVCLGKPVHHVVPKRQPMTRSSLTYHKMRKIEAICDFFSEMKSVLRTSVDPEMLQVSRINGWRQQDGSRWE